MPPFNPKLQNFTILGADGVTTIEISSQVINAQRVRLANVCISYGVQLGLCLMTMLATLLLIPPSRLRRSIYMVHIASLVIAVMRLSLLIQYFPGPLSEYYVIWTKDRTALSDDSFNTLTAGHGLNVIQFAFIELALIMQTWGLIKTWPSAWKYPIRALSIILAAATVSIKALWMVHYTQALATTTVPVPLDTVGQAATVLGAASIFYFCGIFTIDLSVHLIATRGLIKRLERGLTNLEILTIGNGILMVLPTIFAGLDVAANLRGNRVLPFDAGSWVMTLVVIGLPLIGLIARYRGPASTNSSNQASHRFSLFGNIAIHTPKPHARQIENRSPPSPTGCSLMASTGPAQTASTHSGWTGSRAERHKESTGNDDVEMGIHLPPNLPAVTSPFQRPGPPPPNGV